MKFRLSSVLLMVSVLLLSDLGCRPKSKSTDIPFNESVAMRALEAEIEAEARALTDSLFLKNPLYRSDHSLLHNGSLLMSEDMYWLLYDEPIMLYVDDWDDRMDSVKVY